MRAKRAGKKMRIELSRAKWPESFWKINFWFHLQGLHRAVRKENKRKNQNKNICLRRIRTSDPLVFLARHLTRLAIETVDLLYLKRLHYSEVTGNAWVVSKPRGNTMYQIYYDYIMYMYCNGLSDKICISFTNVDVICYCLHFKFVWIHKTIIKCQYIVMSYSW